LTKLRGQGSGIRGQAPTHYTKGESGTDSRQVETERETTMGSLLAVDLGLRTGLALYGRSGRLLWYRSKNFGSKDRLRRGAGNVLGEIADLGWLVLEGDRALAELWEREAKGRSVSVRRASAEEWRGRMLLPREQSSGPRAKQSADELARKIIEWSGAPRPTSLRHDAAEAIVIGLWGVLHVGWLKRIPSEVRR
jgi:hypothetical protein